MRGMTVDYMEISECVRVEFDFESLPLADRGRIFRKLYREMLLASKPSKRGRISDETALAIGSAFDAWMETGLFSGTE